MSADEESPSADHDAPEPAREMDIALEQRLAALTARVYHLEADVAALRGRQPPVAATEPRPLPAPEVPVAASALRTALTASRSADAPLRQAQSLEALVGSQWFNRIGILAVLIGAALFLKLAFDNHWIGPTGRVLIGLAGGVGLALWAERFRRRGFAVFSYTLRALGTGVVYLSLWAASSVYVLVPQGVAFAGMVLVTVANAWSAWRQKAELLAVYAIVGAFATPLLLATGRNQETFLFCYLLLMNLATLSLLVLRGWDRLLLLALAGTALFFAGWYNRFYAPAAFAETAWFLALFVVLFAVAAVWAGQSASAVRGWRTRVLVSALTATGGFAGFLAMVAQRDGLRSPSTAICALVFAVLYLGLFASMPGPDGSAGWRLLRETQLAVAIVLLATAVPLAVHGAWITVEWMAEMAVLVWLATRHRSRVFAVLAACVLGLALVSLAMDATEAQHVVLWNPRMLSFAAAIVATGAAAWLLRRAGAPEWQRVAVAAAVLTHALVVIAVLLEIGTFWSTRPVAASAGYAGYADRRMAERFTDSAWLLLAGAAVLAGGFRRRSAALRWEGLLLLAVTIGKVFVFDTSTLSHGYRSVSFLVLGALLLAVSFAYQRDWLHLRPGAERDAL